MDASQITLLVVYAIGVISNVIIFFIQKAEITKLKNVTDHVERYFKIFNIEEIEKYVEVNKKTSEMKLDNAIQKVALEFGTEKSKQYMERSGKKLIDKHWKKFQEESNDRFNELGYFVLGFICSTPDKEEREKIIDELFPANAFIFREHLKRMEEHPEDYEGFNDSENH